MNIQHNCVKFTRVGLAAVYQLLLLDFREIGVVPPPPPIYTVKI